MDIRTSVQTVKFRCRLSGQGWTLLEMNKNIADVLLLKLWIVAVLGTDPILPSEKDLANKLETTQDIQGFISCVRKLFMQLSGKKKLSKKSRMCSSWFHILQMREREIGRESASVKFYETDKSGRNLSSFFPELWNTSLCELSLSLIFLYVVKCDVVNLGYFGIS